MAKKSAVEKNKRRRTQLVSKMADRRARLKAIADDRDLAPEERFQRRA